MDRKAKKRMEPFSQYAVAVPLKRQSRTVDLIFQKKTHTW